MNILSFEQNICSKFQFYLDSYLNDELLVETTHDLLMHLENCPNCSEALRKRQRLKDHLKSAVLKDSAPTDLQEKIRKRIRNDATKGWTRLMLSVAAMIAFIAVGGGELQFLNRSTPTRPDATYLSNPLLLKIGLSMKRAGRIWKPPASIPMLISASSYRTSTAVII